MKDKNLIDEKVFEIYLEYAGACHLESILEKLDANKQEIDKIIPSNKFNISMLKFIRRKNARTATKKLLKKARIILPKIAVFFMIITLVVATLVTTVDAVRVRFLNFVIEVNKQYTRIHFNDGVGNPVVDQMDIEELLDSLYIPKGFQLKNIENFSHLRIIHFADETGGEIEFIQMKNGAGIRYDTEDANVKEITIHDYKGLLIEKEGLITVVWHDTLYTYDIVGRVDAKELLKMAESVPLY